MEDTCEEEEGVLYVHCNRCQQVLSSFYKSSCGHCFCVECATAHFAKDPCCPVCGLRLSQKHFRGPFDVGISIAEPIETIMFKNVFSSNRLDEVLQRALQSLPAVEDVISLVTTQLYLENQRSQFQQERVERKWRKVRGDLKLTVQEARSKIALLSSQLAEAEAWKRKLNDELATAKQEAHEFHRKNKSMEQILARLRNDGHAIPSALSSPASTPPHHNQHRLAQAHHHPQQSFYPAPSPRFNSSSSKSVNGLQFPSNQKQPYRPASATAISPRIPSYSCTGGRNGKAVGGSPLGFNQPIPQPTPPRCLSATNSLSRSLSPHHSHAFAPSISPYSPTPSFSTTSLNSGRSFGGVSDYRAPYQ